MRGFISGKSGYELTILTTSILALPRSESYTPGLQHLYRTEAAFCSSGARPYFCVAYPTISPTMPPGSMICR